MRRCNKWIGTRPEGPAARRPGRQAGIGVVGETSAEGATHNPSNYSGCAGPSGLLLSLIARPRADARGYSLPALRASTHVECRPLDTLCRPGPFTGGPSGLNSTFIFLRTTSSTVTCHCALPALRASGLSDSMSRSLPSPKGSRRICLSSATLPPIDSTHYRYRMEDEKSDCAAQIVGNKCRHGRMQHEPRSINGNGCNQLERACP